MARKSGKLRRTRGKADKEQRRKEASARGGLRSQRSAKEQLAELDKRLGAGKGATRERSRLTA